MDAGVISEEIAIRCWFSFAIVEVAKIFILKTLVILFILGIRNREYKYTFN